MLQVVAQHRRDDSGSAVGGRGDDLAPAGILFVDRHGIDGQPIGKDVRLRAVGALLVAELLEERAGPPLDTKSAGELALAPKPAIDAGAHRAPERRDTGIDLGLGAEGALVRQHHCGDGGAALVRHLQHGSRVLERIRHARLFLIGRLLRVAGELFLRHDEAAADRKVDLAQVAHPLGVDCLEFHAVGMARERWAVVEDDVVMRIEYERDAVKCKQVPAPPEVCQVGLGALHIEIGCTVAEQAQHHRPVCRVALAGEGKRAMEGDAEPQPCVRRWVRVGLLDKQAEKGPGRRHRPHRVGRGRADADLEDIEDAKEHHDDARRLLGPRWLEGDPQPSGSDRSGPLQDTEFMPETHVSPCPPLRRSARITIVARPGVGEDGAMPTSEGAETGPSQARRRRSERLATVMRRVGGRRRRTMRRIGVDVGGTFTDLILVDEAAGAITVDKVPSTPDDPARAVMTGVDALCGKAGVSLEAVDLLLHGTTVATNITLEHKGAEVGLITTEGFRDILHIARHKKPHNFSLQQELPWQSRPLVRRRHRLTVRERVTAPKGEIIVPLDEAEVRERARALREAGVDAIAVCLLHAYLNPAHEQRIKQILQEECPDAYLSVSSEVLPLYREFERFSTTCLNAYVGPRVASYIGRLEAGLRDAGLPRGVRLMQSSGGMTTADNATGGPVNLMMSGPVAGLIGGIWAGKMAGYDNVFTLDIGGTSADIGVAAGGALRMRHLLDTKIGDYQAMIPMVDIDTIGAGGGSIAYVDDGGIYRVGPQSAGAEPGPACYGRGGSEPTSTDAQVVLGRLRTDRGLVGGQMTLHADLALGAVQSLAGTLDMSLGGDRARRAADPEVQHGAGHRAQQRAARL